MNLISMKSESDDGCSPCPPEAYPYGLRICLGEDQCKALGILGPIKAGTQVNVIALTTVVRCTEETEVDGDDKGNDIYLDLQITDMALAAPTPDAREMYPKSGMEK